MSSDEIMVISDDKEKDSDIELVDISKENSIEVKSSNDDAIVIDDDNVQTENDVIEVIDIDRDTNDKHVKEYLRKVCSENRIIGEFIEKCLDLENSTGMLRVIHRTFLPLYFKMSDSYRESNDFKKLIDMKMRALEVSPNKKFSHLKSVCEIMKSFHKDRKKVNFITLSTEVKAKPSNQRKRRKRRSVNKYKKSKRKPDDIIILDDLDESPSTEVNHDQSPPIIRKDTEISNEHFAESDDVVILEDDVDMPNNSNKENNNHSHNSKNLIPGPSLEINTNNQFLVPQKSEECLMKEKEQRIKTIEKQIEVYKRTIDALEQQEVDNDSVYSPYIKCEKLKAFIVTLYEELCALTGSEAIKKREVRFTATDDRPQLPVKILEDLINENIGSDGNPLLPDFMDVVKCVTQANKDARLGWSQQRIMAEARSLFTYCGQALQTDRKKREWRYLLGRVNSQLDDDPAERDPVLMERLEANRRIAVKKESDILEKYVKMEQNCKNQITPFYVAEAASDDEEFDNSEPATQTEKELTVTSNNHLNISTNFQSVNERYSRMELITSQSESVVYGCHTLKTNNHVHERVNNCDANTKIQQENNINSNKTHNTLLEISIDGNQNEKFTMVNGTGNNNITDEIDERAIVPVNNQTERRMLEVYVERNKPLVVKVINVSSNSVNEKSSQPLSNNIKENGFETNIQEESMETECDLASSDNAIVDDSFITPGIVIKDVYSIAIRKEATNSTQSNSSEIHVSDVAENLIDNINQTSNDNRNEERSSVSESLESKVDKEITQAESNDNIKSEKPDVVNDDLLDRVVKKESSDVLKDMQMFEGSFTTTIFDIEDPFLVIEISDSSDDSDCDMVE